MEPCPQRARESQQEAHTLSTRACQGSSCILPSALVRQPGCSRGQHRPTAQPHRAISVVIPIVSAGNFCVLPTVWMPAIQCCVALHPFQAGAPPHEAPMQPRPASHLHMHVTVMPTTDLSSNPIRNVHMKFAEQTRRSGRTPSHQVVMPSRHAAAPVTCTAHSIRHNSMGQRGCPSGPRQGAETPTVAAMLPQCRTRPARGPEEGVGRSPGGSQRQCVRGSNAAAVPCTLHTSAELPNMRLGDVWIRPSSRSSPQRTQCATTDDNERASGSALERVLSVRTLRTQPKPPAPAKAKQRTARQARR